MTNYRGYSTCNKKRVYIKPTADYIRTMLVAAQYNEDKKCPLYSEFIFPPFMKIGEEGWTVEWDTQFSALHRTPGGTADVLVVKVAEEMLDVYYPEKMKYFGSCIPEHIKRQLDEKKIEDRVYNRVIESIKKVLK